MRLRHEGRRVTVPAPGTGGATAVAALEGRSR